MQASTWRAGPEGKRARWFWFLIPEGRTEMTMTGERYALHASNPGRGTLGTAAGWALPSGKHARSDLNPNCKICHGIGWVCENHPDKVWSEKGCQCGPGMPCRCNETDGIDEPDTSRVIDNPDLHDRRALRAHEQTGSGWRLDIDQ